MTLREARQVLADFCVEHPHRMANLIVENLVALGRQNLIRALAIKIQQFRTAALPRPTGNPEAVIPENLDPAIDPEQEI